MACAVRSKYGEAVIVVAQLLHRAARFVHGAKAPAPKHSVERDHELFPIRRLVVAPIDRPARQPADVVDSGIGKARLGVRAVLVARQRDGEARHAHAQVALVDQALRDQHVDRGLRQALERRKTMVGVTQCCVGAS